MIYLIKISIHSICSIYSVLVLLSIHPFIQSLTHRVGIQWVLKTVVLRDIWLVVDVVGLSGSLEDVKHPPRQHCETVHI